MAVLESYLRRVQVRPGNGLSRAMNSHLRSYPAVADIIQRVFLLLLRTEMLFDSTRAVAMRPMEVYRSLLATEDDWVQESIWIRKPTLTEIALQLANVDDLDLAMDNPWDHGAFAGEAQFKRTARKAYTLPAFHAAMAIARRIGLIEGHGRIAVSRAVMKEIRRSLGNTVAC